MWRQTSKLAWRHSPLLVARVEGIPRYQHHARVEASSMAASGMETNQLKWNRLELLMSLQNILHAYPEKLEIGVLRSIPQRKPSTRTSTRYENSNPTKEVVVTLNHDNDSVLRGESNKVRKSNSKTGASLESKLVAAVLNQDHDAAVALVRRASLKHDFQPSTRIVAPLFSLLVTSDPILAYSILKKGRASGALRMDEVAMYKKLCSAVASMEWSLSRRIPVNQFVTDLVDDLLSMDEEYKQMLLPQMITGLMTQRDGQLGVYAKDLYLHMVNKGYEMRPRWLVYLLSLSKYNRQDDLPFEDILERLAASEVLPPPLRVISVVHNMFPFTDSDKMCKTLKALLQLQERHDLKNFPAYTGIDEILIDLDGLESISLGAAKSGSVDMILLVWDLLMQCNYQATESIYENTVMTFAAAEGHLQSAFGAIVSMKGNGYQVPRALLRSFSSVLRSDKALLTEGMRILASTPDLQTLETYNAMLSCYAERGDSRDVFSIIDIMLRKNIVPDINSYSFAMEATGKNVHRRKQHHSPDLVRRNLDDADRILSMMEENYILPSPDFIRNYVELLCITGESRTANLLVDDMLERVPQSVCSKTLYRLAVNSTENGDFERAWHLASHITDHIPTLALRIQSRQKGSRFVNGKLNQTLE